LNYKEGLINYNLEQRRDPTRGELERRELEKSKAVITSLPVLPSQLILATLEQLNLSPIAAWHYKTMPVPSYVSIAKAEKLLQWHPKKSNKELFFESYDWYKTHRNEIINRQGKTHRVNWNFKILNLISRL